MMSWGAVPANISVHNGQLLIHANGRTYNAFGQAVR